MCVVSVAARFVPLYYDRTFWCMCTKWLTPHRSGKILVDSTAHTCRAVHSVDCDTEWKQQAQQAVVSHSKTARMLRDELHRKPEGEVQLVPSRSAIQREMDEVCCVFTLVSDLFLC